jgi:hypothetical protein
MMPVTGFEIEGVSDALCERFSKRREEIEQQIEPSVKKAKAAGVSVVAVDVGAEGGVDAIFHMNIPNILRHTFPSCQTWPAGGCSALLRHRELWNRRGRRSLDKFLMM